MRFRFCGDLDCPDWVLAEITTLSRVSSVKMKLMCSQVVNDLLGGGIDYEKIYKLTADAKYDAGDVKAAIALLAFILSSATKHGVDEESLSNELQQLGLPKEHTTSLCKVYGEKVSLLEDHFKKTSLRLSRLEDVHWKVDYSLHPDVLKGIQEPTVHLTLSIRDDKQEKPIECPLLLTTEKFRVLLYELKQAYHMMETVA